MCLWHVDCLKLKTVEVLNGREESVTFDLLPDRLKKGHGGPVPGRQREP